MTNLRSALHDIATEFADAVLAAIKSANIEELVEAKGSRPARGRASAPAAPRARAAAKASPPRKRSGRLPRRSAEEIAAILDQIVGLVKKNKDGLRAEQIRADLGLEAKELPRVLKEGLASKKLKSKGQKRATTYFA